MFSGPEASFFGGLEYFTPIDNLSLKLEYDSHDYKEFVGREYVFYEEGNLIGKPDSKFNFALNYRFEPSEEKKLMLVWDWSEVTPFMQILLFTQTPNFSGH